jgi:hypothetical protein
MENVNDIEIIKNEFPNFDYFISQNNEKIKLSDFFSYIKSFSKIDNYKIEKFSKIIFKNDVNKNLTSIRVK